MCACYGISIVLDPNGCGVRLLRSEHCGHLPIRKPLDVPWYGFGHRHKRNRPLGGDRPNR
jgi:hypothetical protein